MQVQELIKRFVPLKDLRGEQLQRLAMSAETVKLPHGDLLFDFGDTSPYTYYLLRGELQLTSREGARIAISPEDEQAAFPLGNLLPRQLRARVRSESARVLKIHRAELERLLASAPPAAGQSGMRIKDLTGMPQNLLGILDAPLLSQLPRDTVRRLLDKLEPMHCRKGQVIVREGEPGDYFYLIKSGSCRVTRSSRGGRIELNHLQALDSFGEGALITGQPRSATVTMESAGQLLRLSRSHFQRLLVQPLLRHMPADKALRLSDAGQARIIDVRSENKFALDHLPGARNIPTYLLYLKGRNLNRQRRYIVHSDSGRQSRAAAFMLAQRGFKVSVLGRADNLPAQLIIDTLTFSGTDIRRCA
jgi:CRP-like cAMP-binding protein